MTGKKQTMDQHASGQVGFCMTRHAHSTDAEGERWIYVRSTSDLDGHNRVCIFMRGLMRLRKSLSTHDTVPMEWNLEPRLATKKGSEDSFSKTGELETTRIPGTNGLCKGEYEPPE